MGGSVDGASGGAGGDGRDDAPIRHVTTATRSIYETGRLAQDRRLYVYGTTSSWRFPRYVGPPYVRFGDDAGHGDRAGPSRDRPRTPARCTR